MPVDRLTPEDQLMLWPDEIWPQENAMLAVLDGSGLFDADGRFRLEAVQETIRSRLHLVPRLRQLLYLPGPGLGRPLWVDAPAFDIREHVRVEPLAGPEDEAALLAAAGGHVRQAAPRTRRRDGQHRDNGCLHGYRAIRDGRIGSTVDTDALAVEPRPGRRQRPGAHGRHGSRRICGGTPAGHRQTGRGHLAGS